MQKKSGSYFTFIILYGVSEEDMSLSKDIEIIDTSFYYQPLDTSGLKEVRIKNDIRLIYLCFY